MIAEKKPRIGPKAPANVPEYMICEIMDGKPLYYKGYRDVLSGKKTFGEIVGSSRLQRFIVMYLVRVLVTKLSEDEYVIFSSELGLHLDRGNNLSGDIVIYEAATMPPEAINEYYSDIPAKVCIEVDISIDTADTGEESYLHKKTQKLLAFGMEKVIWITTTSKKVTIATAGHPWLVIDWDQNIDILDGVTVNIGQYLSDRGVVVN